MKNLPLRLLSLVLASVLSIFVHYFFVDEQSDTSVIQLIAPIQVEKLPRDLAIVSPSTRQAEIALRGPSMSLSRLISSPPVFRVEVPEGVQSRFLAPLRKEDLRLPGDVEILSINPTEFEFKLDRLVERTVPVIVPHIGQLAKGLQIHSLKIQPEKVVLYGPEGELREVVSVETIPLDLRDLKESTSRTLSVRVPGPQIESRSPSIEVHVEVEVVQRELTLRNIALVVRGPAAEMYEARPGSVLLEVAGPERIVSTIDAARLNASVTIPPEAEGEAPVQRELKVSFDLPAGVTIKRIEPALITLVPLSKQNKSGAAKGSSKTRT